MVNDILKMSNITKVYSNGVMANKDVDFSVREGEIHALMGENGAGKSTLMKILFGALEVNSGTITFNGKKVEKLNSHKAIELGIGMVHQHFMLVDSLKVYENVILGMEPKKYGFVDNKSAIKFVEDVAEKYNLKVDPLAKVSDISVGLKQKVEIIKVLARGAKLLILDEPTAVLTPQETEELFDELLLLKQSGHTIIFISHKIKEVRQICDRITVLRGGKTIGVMDVEGSSEEEISNFMVGREVVLKVDKKQSDFKEELLTVKNLTYTNEFGNKMVNNVSFSVKRGQILGVAGVEGNGQNEIAECVFGMIRNAKGNISFKGKNLLEEDIKYRRYSGISYIPEDRITTGVAADLSIWENIIADRVDKPVLKTNIFLSKLKIKEMVTSLIKEFTILAKNMHQQAAMLSGGNMQKIVVAREFSADPDLLIANQPTRGIDVGANEFIWKKIVDLRDEDKGILLISADLNEILELSDSIMVMHDGEVAAYFENASELTEKELGLYMLGIKKQESLEISSSKEVSHEDQ